ncbi:IS256 family transposase [Clostridioides difficile]|nr:IS256 family transposase [Clostridioides difficile]EQG63102.1 transposase mutator type domain protein [Clostridioides difficile DA00145]MCD8634522.1 IS256 family transposase [Clostridioides difficile]MCE4653879.1 IS256 family transposase [Clostridioides difficile]MCE4706174.1 IS256 family transposase [Clostridioides difficile]MCE4721453.1 IS256 family transposase [Clostridioides difficile]
MKEVLEILIGENESSKYLKKVYAEITEEVALSELSLLEEKLGTQYAINWNELSTYFKYPQEIRTLIYTANSMES